MVECCWWHLCGKLEYVLVTVSSVSTVTLSQCHNEQVNAVNSKAARDSAACTIRDVGLDSKALLMRQLDGPQHNHARLHNFLGSPRHICPFAKAAPFLHPRPSLTAFTN